MKQHKAILFIFASILFLLIIGGILGSLLRLINEIRYTLEYFLPYWLITPIILLGIGAFILFIIQFIWPWWKQLNFKGAENKANIYKTKGIGTSRHKAAKQTLEGIERLVDRIHNNVSREALQRERERVQKELVRGDLVVVVFGSGSSGKTSLIRAMLNEIVGDVGSVMGSTLKSKMYRLHLRGLKRVIQLIDTPGILESGEEGEIREKEAKIKASRSDLMIFVIDSDLRSSEIKAIKTLSTIGKKIILVLNKCDLRGEGDEKRLLNIIKNQCNTLISPENIISASASPQTIPMPGRNPIQPKPEIDKLINRLAIILHNEGEELIADNILLQCKNLGSQGRIILNNQRKRSAKICIDKYSWISSGVIAATPLPGVDLLGAAAVNAQMVMEIAKIYGLVITKQRAQELALSVGKTLTGIGVVKGGIAIFASVLSLNIPALILSKVIQSITAAWLTRVAGASFITYFQQDQDWGDGGIQEVVQGHYELNKRDESIKRFIEVAFKRVIEPLQNKEKVRLPPRRRPPEEEASLDP